MNEKLRAACGLDCKQCGAYIARKTNDDALRAKTAKEWSATYGVNFSPKQINCVGCLVDGEHSGYCFACPIRACVIDKKLPHCYSCSDFTTCQKRQDFEQHAKLDIKKLFET